MDNLPLNDDMKKQDRTFHGEREVTNKPILSDNDEELMIGQDVIYTEDYVNVDGVRVFYRFANSSIKNAPQSRFSILLLHGQIYSSNTWKRLGTLQYLCKSEYFPVAVDLPGYGNTKSHDGDRVNFLRKLIQKLNLVRPVLLSPSMSGMYSVQYVIKHPEDLRGFIPVAPVMRYSKSDFAKLDLPSLILYGDSDFQGQKTSEILSSIPGSKMIKIPSAKHAAYLDNPQFFHESIKAFLDNIHEKEINMQ